jgi:hypothetical protein
MLRADRIKEIPKVLLERTVRKLFILLCPAFIHYKNQRQMIYEAAYRAIMLARGTLLKH